MAYLELTATILLVYVAPVLAWASVILHARTPWRRTEMGRHLMAYALVIAVILTFAFLRRTFDDNLPPLLEVLRFIAYMTLIPVMAHRVWLQIKAARH